jgi:lysophospholipase L1-like esterase
MAPSTSKAMAILGDSITDGRGSTTDQNDRWPDDLAKRLQANAATAGVAVLNLGIGANTVLSGGKGPTAVTRYDSDILGQSGVAWVIIYEGVNDLGGGASAASLETAYQQFIDKAHAKNLKIYGIPITPFGGYSDYAKSANLSARTQLNTWVRAAGHFDAVIDLDAAVRDPSNPDNLQAAYSSDGLHLTPAGYQKMADSIDLTLFTP